MFKSVTESLAVGNVISAEELKKIADEGYQTIIDLCLPSEGNPMNMELVKELGFQYINIPVDRQNLSSEVLKSFIEAVNSAPKPIYTRCASGLRAGVMTLLTLANQEGWTEQEYIERRQALGIEHKPNCPLEAFSREFFQTKIQ